MKVFLDDIRIKENVPNHLTVDGCIYVLVGDMYFPSYQWFDLISANFELWIPNLISFANRHTDSAVLMFMDGPYQIKLMRGKNGSVHASCLENPDRQLIIAEIDFEVFLDSVAKCLKKLATAIYMIDTQKKYGQDIAQLGITAKELRNLLE